MGLSIGHAHTTNSLIQKPHAGFADHSEGALCAGLSNQTGISFITDSGINFYTASYRNCHANGGCMGGAPSWGYGTLPVGADWGRSMETSEKTTVSEAFES